ncbi:DUF2273 domain-containing protein [uncultured Sporomusa sp.]|uniref:DUF2273 domain-containing protein n=1 Tax=uncultured Sporomusa sp. TaxID=307249 RepID=UPI002585E600|nr:DUF2273 domain-containing protein [uncultured Sporomusa sp.]
MTALNSKLLAEIWQNHSGKMIGVLVGFVIGILILTFGFFQTLFVALCAAAGYVVGKRIDQKEDIMEILDKLLPPGYNR